MKAFYVVLCATGIFLAGCKKSSTPGASQSLASYQPMDAGSSWSYKVTETLNPSSSLLLQAAEVQLGYSIPSIDTSWSISATLASTDTVINNMNYSVLVGGQGGLGNVYFNKTDSNYYGIGIIPAISLSGVGSLVAEEPILYLKDTLAGTTWTQTEIDSYLQDTTYYTIAIKTTGGSWTVNGKTFTNVTHETVSALPGNISALAAQAGIPSSINLAIVGDYYFARGVGLIEVNINASLYGFSYDEQLISYDIK
ncbi:hypothetical protein [Dinghuibacter sp.]|uniref:hypothetical protein n=1 Tax=Dinghuibacter sp. TaxID=2024697 RepID=UPI002D806A74|nr:hypothetical protein [Dinghuibacter sp.]